MERLERVILKINLFYDYIFNTTLSAIFSYHNNMLYNVDFHLVYNTKHQHLY